MACKGVKMHRLDSVSCWAKWNLYLTTGKRQKKIPGPDKYDASSSLMLCLVLDFYPQMSPNSVTYRLSRFSRKSDNTAVDKNCRPSSHSLDAVPRSTKPNVQLVRHGFNLFKSFGRPLDLVGDQLAVKVHGKNDKNHQCRNNDHRRNDRSTVTVAVKTNL